MTSQALPLYSSGLRQAGSVLRIIGVILAIFGATMLLPMAVSLLAREPSAEEFVEAAAVTAACGGMLWFGFRRFNFELQARDGFLLVTVTWGLLPAFGTFTGMARIYPKKNDRVFVIVEEKIIEIHPEQ